MNLAHLHLLLNHWPIIGSFIGLGMLILALAEKSDDLKQASFASLSLLALVALPAYMSGNAAQEMIQRSEGVSQALIETHQGAALIALVFIEITGALAWVGLWQFRRDSRPATWTVPAVVMSATATVGFMMLAGNTGGEIRHPEIQSGEEATSVIGALGFRLVGAGQYFVADLSRWIWPILEDLHFLGLALLLGATGLLNLRVLGFFKQLPAGPMRRFLPWGIAGLALNTITGMLFFIGMPFFYVYNIDFHYKMVAIVLAGANLLLHSSNAMRECDSLGPGQDASPFAKFFAGSSIALWMAVIVLGRYIPQFEDSLRP
jgi:uncharacterized membrane protein